MPQNGKRSPGLDVWSKDFCTIKRGLGLRTCLSRNKSKLLRLVELHEVETGRERELKSGFIGWRTAKRPLYKLPIAPTWAKAINLVRPMIYVVHGAVVWTHLLMFIFGIYDNKFLNYYAFYLRTEPILAQAEKGAHGNPKQTRACIAVNGRQCCVEALYHPTCISENYSCRHWGSFRLKICHNMWKVFRSVSNTWSEESGDCP